jgi:hypothetical protein
MKDTARNIFDGESWVVLLGKLNTLYADFQLYGI